MTSDTPSIAVTPKYQIPPDFAVKAQPIDIAELILSLIHRLHLFQTLCSNSN